MEMILKLMALGGREYVKNRWNCFDGTIVVLSVVDMVMSYTKVVDGAGLSVLRTFRLVSSLYPIHTNAYTCLKTDVV